MQASVLNVHRTATPAMLSSRMANPAEAAIAKVVRLYSRHEDVADLVVHVLGIVFAINASLWLLFHVTGLPVVVSVTVYCLGLTAMIGFSAAYNLMPQHRPSKGWL